MKPVPAGDPKPLPQKSLRFSKRMVALSLAFMISGVILIMGPWSYSLVTGVICGGLGMAVFFSAGYYWGCDNESCS